MSATPQEVSEPLLATTGEFRIATFCPACDQPVTMGAVIDIVLKRPRLGDAALRLAMSSKALPHDCDVDQLTLDTDTGELK